MVNLSELNEAQQKAVEYIDGSSLVIAGAGSGKTRVLTYKIAYLLDKGYKPWNILALTFTNKAAREMQERIARQVGTELASQLWMGTFHSILSRILRIEAASLGFSSNFTIYDASDSKSLVKTILRELNLDEKVYKPATVCNRISEAKNGLVFPDQYRMDSSIQQRDYESKMTALGEVYLRYMQRCRLSDAMDFDDLLLYAFYLFEKYPDILSKYQDRFQYVLVDEYQDTNYAQHRIVWQITQNRQRVCVVGDDAQSIYSFRGANIDNILRFQSMYDGAKLFKLERNYRSTQTIVNAANSLISFNKGQIKKDVYSEKSEGSPIHVLDVESDLVESMVVSERINRLHHREHIPYSDFAILYRTNSQSRSLEDAIRKQGIPYKIYGGLSFYQRKEIKDVIAYLRLTLNPRDEEAMRRVINYPARGIGDTTLSKVMACASKNAVSPWQILLSPEEFSLDVNKGTVAKLQKFSELIMSFHALIESEDAYTLAKRIVQSSGIAADINKGTEPEDISRQENFQEMLDSIAAFVEEHREEDSGYLLGDYLQEVSLISDLDEKNTSEDGSDSNDKVTLMTIHSAKGLEFRIVFVVGLEENLFPNEMALHDGQRGLEEERRLMYVAMTRAEEQLFLSSAKSRFRFGKVEMSSPSRFLHEIDSKYLYSNATNNSSLFSARETSRTPSRTSNPFARSATSMNPSQFRSTDFGTSSPSFGASSRKTTSADFPSTVWGKTLKRVSSVSSVPQRSVTPVSQSTGQGSATSSATSSASNNSKAISVGCQVQHSRFGHGTVLSVEGTGLDMKATVKFDNVGTKQLLLRFAKIEVL